MSVKRNNKSLLAFDIDPARGFLPALDPLDTLPGPLAEWDETARSLPKLLVSDRLRKTIETLPPFYSSHLHDEREWRRAMVILSYLGHAYVWGEPAPVDRLPSRLAVPWHEVASHVGRPPVLSYASYALDNWRRFDANRPIDLGNIALLQNFLGGVDEEWFILIHVDIEAKAALALSALWTAKQAAETGVADHLESSLIELEAALGKMNSTLVRMPERCDPYIYYHRVRPYIHGWKNNPALPEGVIYEGVEAYGGRPQQFRGETGAQSSIIPALDGALGVTHADDPLKTYLLEMRDYMPPKHRAFIERMETGPSIREFIGSRFDASSQTAGLFNACVEWIERFRSLHLEYAARYIHKQAQSDSANPVSIGTGGTPFMKYLKKHRDETAEKTLAGPERKSA